MIKRYLPWALKFGLTAGLLGVLIREIGLAPAFERLAAVTPGFLALAAVMVVAQMPLAAWRWHIVLRAIGAVLPFGVLLRLSFVGLFFSQALPSSVGGDAVRIYEANRRGIGLRSAVTGVLLDRLVTLLSLVFLVLLAQPLYLLRITDGIAQWVFPAIAGLSVAGVILLLALDRLPVGWKRPRVVQGVLQLGADARLLLGARGAAAGSLAVSALAHLNLALATYVLARGLGLPLSAVDCMLLVLPVVLLTSLPISIGGWGVRETAMVAALALVGIPAAGALALSILVGLVTLAVALSGGLLFLLQARRRVEETAAPAGARACGRG